MVLSIVFTVKNVVNKEEKECQDGAIRVSWQTVIRTAALCADPFWNGQWDRRQSLVIVQYLCLVSDVVSGSLAKVLATRGRAAKILPLDRPPASSLTAHLPFGPGDERHLQLTVKLILVSLTK